MTPFIKNLIIVCLIITACAVVVRYTGLDKPPASSKAAPAAAEPALAVSTVVLGDAYAENEIAADRIYRNKRLDITGRIENISEILGTVRVDLEAPQNISVSCRFDDSQRDSVASLKTGQSVTLEGMNDGLTGKYFIEIDNCIVK
jgi:hypothetical protein